ncbi:MAG: TetR family transcriptional regulator [Longimicrobiales bacterium]|nr:TetR family transcriptional regulator [Longimicrobiales bacterium]
MARLTERGRRTRDRILQAAVEEFSARGFADTSISQVLEASGTGKSQFYHYFESKADLVRQVLRFLRLESLPNRNPDYGHLDSWDRLRSWFDRLLELTEDAGSGGLDLVGAFPADLAEDPQVRREIRRTLDMRRRLLCRGLRRMKRRGELRDDADPQRLARFAAAAIEGGLRLSSAEGSTDVLRDALDETWVRLREHAAA